MAFNLAPEEPTSQTTPQTSTNLLDWTPTALRLNANGTVFVADPTVANSNRRSCGAVMP
jgi:hypothetical protein